MGLSGTRAVVLARERGERGHEAWAHRLLGEMASPNRSIDDRPSPDGQFADANRRHRSSPRAFQSGPHFSSQWRVRSTRSPGNYARR